MALDGVDLLKVLKAYDALSSWNLSNTARDYVVSSVFKKWELLVYKRECESIVKGLYLEEMCQDIEIMVRVIMAAISKFSRDVVRIKYDMTLMDGYFPMVSHVLIDIILR
ncbi:hypothetical protein KSU1_C0236 [Candidatus Jettenia caeni]|uniref:Uncharacterized protein n=1 Tax=Candidatus Jettenia caeni TaxID=247490 RepID=I3IJD7_9BACT|nr:hypothetical protein [Candidatus Jettenia sp. AMX1]KAA0250869.1 MAG: hypothetical protein EDM77_03420 [Candidatus Jettenia sp. AMX1]MDL1938433.1 hypothetical protein [Candidatus Jettenia sp. AMX1]GAB61832.1 hypothetical protein KSU1_C0236 [Candidatus Jettenia caeni]